MCSCGSLSLVPSLLLATVSTHHIDLPTFASGHYLHSTYSLLFFCCEHPVVMGKCCKFRFVFLSHSVCVSGIWHCYWEYSLLNGKSGSNITISDIGFHTDFSIYLKISETWLIFSMLSLLTVPKPHTCLFSYVSFMLHNWW